jgi:formate dehydrogenase maturation protein FdhE
MNKEQIAKYLKNPDQCPYCGSNNVDTLDYGFESEGTEPFVWNQCSCICGKKWKEVYTLKTIEDVE